MLFHRAHGAHLHQLRRQRGGSRQHAGDHRTANRPPGWWEFFPALSATIGALGPLSPSNTVSNMMFSQFQFEVAQTPGGLHRRHAGPAGQSARLRATWSPFTTWWPRPPWGCSAVRGDAAQNGAADPLLPAGHRPYRAGAHAASHLGRTAAAQVRKRKVMKVMRVYRRPNRPMSISTPPVWWTCSTQWRGSMPSPDRAGRIRVHFVEKQTCCGQPAYTSGHEEEARKVAQSQMALFPSPLPGGGAVGLLRRHDAPPHRRLFPESPWWPIFAIGCSSSPRFLARVCRVRWHGVGRRASSCTPPARPGARCRYTPRPAACWGQLDGVCLA